MVNELEEISTLPLNLSDKDNTFFSQFEMQNSVD